MKPFVHAFHLLQHLCSHWLIAAVVLLAIWAFEHFVTLLFHEENPRFFNQIPIKYVFQAMDFGVLVVIGVMGLIAIFLSIWRSIRN